MDHDSLSPITLEPDPRWTSFASTYEDVVRLAETWPLADETADRVARMLEVARLLFSHAWFTYDFLLVASVWSLLGVEAALLDALGERPRPGSTLRPLADRAAKRGLLSTETAERLRFGAKLRNSVVHADGQQLITPGMAEQIIDSSHRAVAELYAGKSAGR